MKTIEEYFTRIEREIIIYHNEHISLINTAKGSSGNHQNWVGGYRDHIEQCLFVSSLLYNNLKFNFSFSSVIRVLYFHDIEKIFKYNVISDKFLKEKDLCIQDKNSYFGYINGFYGIKFSDEETVALKLVHGENEHYSKGKRAMNELCSLCHSADILSARAFHDKKRIG